MSSNLQDITTHKVTTIVSLVLSIYGNVRYLVGRYPFDPQGSIDVSETPFSSNTVVTLIYWAILYCLQISFVSQIFIPAIENLEGRLEVTRLVGWHFTIFGLGTFLWSLLFSKQHYFLSEVILLINFFNILSLYFNHKTYAIKPLSNWILIHLPISAFPLSWLFYAIFWNGAVLFHVHKIVGRIISNILIWDFLIVPAFFMFVYNDWGVGLSSTILVFGLALGQLFIKVFALQWIFAFVIAGLLLIFTLISGITGSLYTSRERVLDHESAPLLESS